MKILHVLPSLHLGGVERYVIDLANMQARRGHDVSVMCAGGSQCCELDSSIGFYLNGVEKKSLRTGLPAARALARLQREQRWDVVNCHSRVPLYVAWLARLQVPMKVVMTCHSCYSKNFGLWPLKRVDGAICCSTSVEAWLEGFLPPRHRVVVNGTPEPKHRHVGSADPYDLLFVGRLTALKGLDTLLRALARLGHRKARLTVIGEGPKGDELKALAGELGLADSVQWCGQGSEEEVEKAMSRAGLLVCPSLQEGFSLVRSKGAHVGVLMLLSDLPVNREALRRPQPLAAPGDPEAWALALERWFETGEGAADLDLSKLPGLEDQYEGVMAFYRQIVQGALDGRTSGSLC